MTALELLADVRKNNPGMRFARSSNNLVVGLWNDTLSRFQALFWAIDEGKWVNAWPYEIIGNNTPISDWIED